jgi:hypothetical protein
MSIRASAIAAVLLLSTAGVALADDQAVKDEARTWAMGAVICIGLSVLMEIVLKVAVILYIVRDAPKRGMDPLIWIIVAVFAEVIGLIVYICIRKPLLRASA